MNQKNIKIIFVENNFINEQRYIIF